MNPRFHSRIESPIGPLLLTCDEAGLTGVYMDGHTAAPPLEAHSKEGHRLLDRAGRQLREFFERRRQSFDLPLSFGGTPFQRDVWRALQTIPIGQTRTYGQIARAVGRPAASRAVGVANARNPVSIVVPCHRVIGATGDLTGYAGGLKRKRWLLDFEALADGRRSGRGGLRELTNAETRLAD